MVVLPAPLGPSRQKTSPRVTSKLIPPHLDLPVGLAQVAHGNRESFALYIG
jgi:hypothetical protein